MNTPTIPDIPAPNDEAFVELLPDSQPNPDDKDKQVVMSQSKFNELIRKKMGIAGSEARARAAELEREVTLLKEKLAGGSPDSSDLEKARGELASLRLEQAAILEKSIKQQKDLLISQESQKHNFVDADTMRKLLSANLKHNQQSGTFDVVDDNGAPVLNAAQEPISVSDFFAHYANTHSWLVRGTVKGGSGSSPSQGHPAPAAESWQKYFGPSSDARSANALAMTNKPAYDRLKLQWQRETGQR